MCAPREARRTMYRDVVRKRLRARKARKCVSRVVRRAPVLLTAHPKRPLSLRYATQPTGKRRLEVTELTSNVAARGPSSVPSPLRPPSSWETSRKYPQHRTTPAIPISYQSSTSSYQSMNTARPSPTKAIQHSRLARFTPPLSATHKTPRSQHSLQSVPYNLADTPSLIPRRPFPLPRTSWLRLTTTQCTSRARPRRCSSRHTTPRAPSPIRHRRITVHTRRGLLPSHRSRRLKANTTQTAWR